MNTQPTESELNRLYLQGVDDGMHLRDTNPTLVGEARLNVYAHGYAEGAERTR